MLKQVNIKSISTKYLAIVRKKNIILCFIFESRKMHYFNVVRNAFFIVLCLILFLMPAKMATSIGIMLLGLFWLLDYDYKSKWNNLIRKRLWIPLAILVGYFLVHLFSMLYTENISEGWFVLQKKLLFIVAPLLLFTMPEELQTPRHFKALGWSFIAGCFAVTMASLIAAGIQFLQTKDVSWFYYCKISPFQHPSYMAMYMVFSLAVLETLVERIRMTTTGWIFASVYAVISIVYIILLQSKAGLLSLAILILFLMALSIFKRERSRMIFAGLLLVFSVGCFLLIPAAGSRMQESVAELNDNKTVAADTGTSTSARMLVWGEAWQLFQQHWLGGVGVGDTQNALNRRYEAAGMKSALQREYNCHSQILQTAVTLGVLGILILIAIFCYPLFTLKSHPFGLLALFFLLLIGANILVEAMWETIAGVSFFTLGYTLINSVGVKSY